MGSKLLRLTLAAIGCVLASMAANGDPEVRTRDIERAGRPHGDSPRDTRPADRGGSPEIDRMKASKIKFSCDFVSSPTDCGFQLQARASERASIAKIGRDGRGGLRLRTEPDDTKIAGSGDMERADVYLSQEETGCYEGREQWWEHSILFPHDLVFPTWQMYVLFDFHHTGHRGQANFHVNFANGQLIFRGYGGEHVDDGEYVAPIGPVVKNVWYNFVYHVKWSSGNDGFMDA